jgi:hypothetical protein
MQEFLDVFAALVLPIILITIFVVILARSIRIIPQASAGIVERLGRYHRTLDAGLALVVPFIDRLRPLIDLREKVVSFPPQPVITSDNLVVEIDTVIYFQVTNPKSAVYEIENYITGIEAGYLAYVRGRLMVAGQGVDKQKIWNITTAPGSSANNPSALFTHPNTEFNWVGFAGGQNQIYCAGYAGNKSLIYKTGIKADGTALDIPTVAAELPMGEIVTTIDAYLGYVVIGLTTGLRFCSSDSDGNLVVGPLIETGTSVNAFAAIGQYIYFGWTNYDTTSTGIGRLDIATQISTNQPAYASDLMVTGQGAVVDIHEFDNKPVFTVSGIGAYRQHTTNLVSSATLESGVYRWGVPDTKFIPKWDLRTEPLYGTVAVSVAADSGEFRSVGVQATEGSLESTFDGFESKVFEAEARLTLTRSSTEATKGPVVTRWLGRAYAAPLRSQIFSVPLLLHHKLNLRGFEYTVDVDAELNYLRDLVESPRVITYQENADTFSVIVEDVRWQPVDSANNHNAWDWNGTCTVIMRSVR